VAYDADVSPDHPPQQEQDHADIQPPSDGDDSYDAGFTLLTW
jgi:hypothetical protein